MLVDDLPTERGPLWFELSRGRVLLAAGAAAVQVGGTFATATLQHRAGPDALGVALLAAGPLMLVLPGLAIPGTVVAVVSTAIYVAAGYPLGPVAVGAALWAARAILAGRRPAAWLIAGGGWAGTGIAARFIGTPLSWAGILNAAAWAGCLLLAAEALKARWDQDVAWARARLEERRRRASEERLEVARDLHDGIAHQMSMVSLRAGVALHLVESGDRRGSEEARTALAAIRESSAEALEDLRSAAGLLKPDGIAAPRQAVAGLSGLQSLVSQWDGAGLSVWVVGDPERLPATVDQLAFRVIQEGLANVARHSAAASAEVVFRRDGTQISITITDPGPPLRTAGVPALQGARLGTREGGLSALRERVLALGGAISASSHGSGWRATAVLPCGSMLPEAPPPIGVTPTPVPVTRQLQLPVRRKPEVIDLDAPPDDEPTADAPEPMLNLAAAELVDERFELVDERPDLVGERPELVDERFEDSDPDEAASLGRPVSRHLRRRSVRD